MILTCPECASRYFVDDAKVGSAGRVVRCASCGARWTARNEAAADEELFDAPPASTPASEVAAPAATLDPLHALDDTPEAEPPVSALPGEELPKVFRARADAERRLKEAKTTGIVWGGMVAVMVVILVGAGVFRLNIGKLWPSTAGAYAMVGAPINTIGLIVEESSIRAEPSMKDGHAAITITGVIRNITEKPVAAPPLRIALLNKAQKRVAGQLAAAADPMIPPGQTRHFSVTLLDPPSSAQILEVAFAVEKGAGHAVKTGLDAAKDGHGEPELRGAQDTPAEDHAAAEGHADESAAEGAGHDAPAHETGTAEPAPADHH
ncbi:MJ0042-type zinc finger domain-containing protein [Caulobacter hibisci]|uniref:Zinc-ribbon domain-containing protein n=1 Tax=Caulobacter hibisci TaxID=2035993 RepID=A0ABS0SWP2_9CAUL|nr:MJ0042-type zinc finger domain-containing protein [Caulobacter hibisci]MBI1684026.1 zinc-ribbon domain-containing protein [Caulobacter hibisci]